MRERPVLFSAPMVRAILAGSKTQTRRNLYVLRKFSRSHCYHRDYPPPFGAAFDVPPSHGWTLSDWQRVQPGDRLWVRESFQPLLAEGFDFRDADWQTGKGYAPRYVATDGAVEWIDPDDNISSASKPSIHMPRWASRITLEVTEVRVERLTAISNADAIAEGIETCPRSGEWRDYLHPERYALTPRNSFRSLWEAINGPDGWEDNPWVRVVQFRRLPLAA